MSYNIKAPISVYLLKLICNLMHTNAEKRHVIQGRLIIFGI